MAKGKKKAFLQEIASVEEEVEEIAEKVAMEEPEFLVEEEDAGEPPSEKTEGKKMKKQEFLDSIGMGGRPGSQLAATKWEEYCVGI